MSEHSPKAAPPAPNSSENGIKPAAPGEIKLVPGLKLKITEDDYYEVREIAGNRLVLERWAKIAEVAIDPLVRDTLLRLGKSALC